MVNCLSTLHSIYSHPERILIEIRRLSFHHLYGHNPQRPNVHFGSIGFPGHHLRSHPVWSPHHCAAFALLWCYLGTEAEVSCKERKKCVLGSIYLRALAKVHMQIKETLCYSVRYIQYDMSVDLCVFVYALPHWVWPIRPSPAVHCHSWCLCGWPGWNEETPGPAGPGHWKEWHKCTKIKRDGFFLYFSVF